MSRRKDIQRCARCILPAGYPDLDFDESGVCSECRRFDEAGGPAVDLDSLKKKVEGIIAESKVVAPHYDALVAFSGGKDSSYLIKRLQDDYQLRILAFTLDNWFLPQQTFSNMSRVIESLGVDHVIFKPDFELCRRIYRSSAEGDHYPTSLLKHGSAVCISCIRMVGNLALRLAIEKRIPMMMMGNSPGQIIQSEHELLYRDNRIPYELKRRLFKPLANEISDDVYHYLMLTKDEYQTKPFPYTISILPIIGYDEAEIYRTVEALGWKRPSNVDSCSTNCRMNSLGVVKHCQKHGFHPYEAELSMMVRMGRLDRQTALERIAESTRISEGIAVEVAKKLESN